MKNKICATIVSFNGCKEIMNTVKAIESQVNAIVIIDNNSDAATINVLERLSSANIFVIYNKSNLGIARALNQGVEYAKINNFDWILTLDQDSICDNNLIAEFEDSIDLYSANSTDSKVKVFTPRICYDNNIDIPKRNKHEECLASITSGNLINLNVFDKIGNYNEMLFIDSVDFDFCLRLNNDGFKMIRNNDTVIYHSLGLAKKYWFITIHVHSSIRRYYISRNHIFIMKKYFFSNMTFCLKKQIWFTILILQIIFFESNKIKNIKSIYSGLKDGINNNFSNNCII